MRSFALNLLSMALDHRLLRYISVSAIALCVDLATTALLIFAQNNIPLSAATGYICGIIVHWLLSSRKVFADGVASSGFDRTRQKAMFVVSALIGLALTVAIMWSAQRLGFDTRMAKLLAVGVSFIATYLLRNHLVFRKWA